VDEDFDRGTIRGVVSGLTVVTATSIPANNHSPGWRIVVFVDERASDARFEPIVVAYAGQLGRPLADLAALIGEVVDVKRAPIVNAIRDGAGTRPVGDAITAEPTPFTGPEGKLSTLHDSIMSAAERGKALGLLDRAFAAASSLGMAAVAQGIQTLQASQAGGTSPAGPAAEATAPEVASNMFRREGDYWSVRYEGSVVRLKDAKGLHHLARLLAHPAREFYVTDLEAAHSQGAPPGQGDRAQSGELEERPDLGDAGELLDATAKAAYRARLDELQAELDEADRFNDPVRAANARQEMDFLVGELARAVGLGGRDRRAASHAERARLNATRAIRAAMANVARANPTLGRHLSATIRTGRYCSYTPDPRAPINWEL